MSTPPIEITVKTTYIPEQSNAAERRYVYAYTITLKNCGEVPAQLVSRRWVIHDANNQKREVAGMGVVGEQPRLLPGEDYTYTSGVILETQTGTMGGSYQMQTDEADMFEAPIPTFALAPPHAIH